MEEAELIKYNAYGMVPGPEETEEEFQKRVEFCLSLKAMISKDFGDFDAKWVQDTDDQILLKPAFQEIEKIYGIKPLWVPIFFSNFRLWPWHGASAWIFQLRENGPLGACIQIRKALYDRDLYLKIYHRDELLTHEFCHIGRMAFEEKKYEELLAYRLSKRFFTQFFAPILLFISESRLFILLLLTTVILDIIFLSYGALDTYFHALWFKGILLLWLIFGSFQMFRRKGRMQTVLVKLQAIFQEAESVLFRLTDREIEQFYTMPLHEIRYYMENETSLRWKVIKAAYPIKQG